MVNRATSIQALQRGATRQQGATLVIALIFLVILAFLGANVATTNVLQERMAGNTRNKDLAFQAAEYALKDADANRVNGINWASGPWDNSVDYLIADPDHDNDTTYWRDDFDWDNDSYTPATPIPGNGVSSSYVVERMSGGTAYRVTARGRAPNNADAVLQITYVF